MTLRRPLLAVLARVLVALGLIALAGLASVSRVEGAAAAPVLPEPDDNWFEGASGFAKGFERAEAEGQAVLLYFYADWCGYCRQLESNLLYQAAVEDYTKYLVKIRVNPEDGPQERELAGRYGVRGYPAVFVHKQASVRPQKVGRSVVDSGKRRLMTPDEYVRMLTMASGRRFIAL
ncbi:MAG: thioredoxin domain-containing protein [Thermoanaerobaculia bacterium]